MKVTLDDMEVTALAYQGVESNIAMAKAGMNGVRPGYTRQPKNRWQSRIEAHLSEYAVSKLTRRKWLAQEDPWGPDVAPDIQVKYTDYANGHLLIPKPARGREAVMQMQRFVLVRPIAFDGFTMDLDVVGWIFGVDGMKEEFLKDLAGKGEPGWYVPAEKPRPIMDLILRTCHS